VVEDDPNGRVKVVVPKLLPDRGVKRNSSCVSDLGVEKPISSISNPDVLRELMAKLVTTGAARLTLKVRLGAGDGVTSVPSLCRLTEISMVPDTVPL